MARYIATSAALIAVVLAAIVFFMAAPSPVGATERDVIELPGWSNRDIVTVVTLRPTEKEGCVAEVFMQNRPVNGNMDNGTYQMWSDALGVAVNLTYTYNWQGGDHDLFEFEVPMGLIAVPPAHSLHEQTDATTWICIDRGLGS